MRLFPPTASGFLGYASRAAGWLCFADSQRRRLTRVRLALLGPDGVASLSEFPSGDEFDGGCSVQPTAPRLRGCETSWPGVAATEGWAGRGGQCVGGAPQLGIEI